MESLVNNINEYLDSSSKLSFQIKGVYGKGKTYFVKNILPKELEELGNKRLQVWISLFDLQNIKDIPAKLLNAFINSKREKNQSIDEDINRGYDYLETKYGRENTITNYSISNIQEVIFKIIPNDKVYICLDDVSRFVQKGDIEDFVGFVNELVENLDYKVILIWNDSDHLTNENYVKCREKIIGRSFEYNANISVVVNSFAEETNDNDFKSYISENIKYFLPETYQNNPLRKHFENLRSLKFALDNFHDVFKLYKDDLSDDKVKLRLLYYLTFTIGVSLEFKAGALSEYNKRNIDKYPEEKVEHFDENIDNTEALFAEDIPFKEEGKTDKESNIDYSKSFYEFYIDINFGQVYVFHPQLYSHIISGTELNKEELENNLNNKVTLIPEIGDGNAIVDKIMYRLVSYSDEEFEYDLKKLIEYTEKGNLRSINYFINSAIYLYGYRDIIGLNECEIKEVVNKGLEIFTQKVNVSDFEDSILDAMEPQILEECKWIISAIREKLKIKKSDNMQSDLQELIILFKSDIASFSKKLLSDKQNTSDYLLIPILENFPHEAIKEGINHITPEGVNNLYSLAKQRYNANLKSEIRFWQTVYSYLHKYVDSHKPSLTKSLIERNLLPHLKSKFI